MRGLIIKDVINLRKNIKIFGILIILYGGMSMMTEDTSFFGSIMTMLFAILTLSIYSYDDMAKWDAYALTMPITKDEVVQGKYFMMLSLTLIGAIVGGVFTIVINVIRHTTSIFNGFGVIGAGAAIVIFFYCIIMPFVTKLGVEKARLIFFMVYAIPFVVVMAISKIVGKVTPEMPDWFKKLVEFLIEYVYLIVPLMIALALAISYTISIKVYRKKVLIIRHYQL